GRAHNLRVPFRQVQKYEKIVNRVGAGRLARIADVLNVPVAFFFTGDLTPAPANDSVSSGLSFLETAGAVRLVRAYAQIDDPQIRRALVDLAEEISGARGRDALRHGMGYETVRRRARKEPRRSGRLS